MSSSSSPDTPDEEAIDIMHEISRKYPVLHTELVKKLPIITSNIDTISDPKDKKKAKQIAFKSISDRLLDSNLKKRFAKKFDIPYKRWDVNAERNLELSNKRLRRIIEHDRSADPGITVINPHVRVVKDDGTVNYETVRFGPPLLQSKQGDKRSVNGEKKTKGGRKTNNKKKISKQKRTLRKK